MEHCLSQLAFDEQIASETSGTSLDIFIAQYMEK